VSAIVEFVDAGPQSDALESHRLRVRVGVVVAEHEQVPRWQVPGGAAVVAAGDSASTYANRWGSTGRAMMPVRPWSPPG
jgi:hypothetical protein